VGVTRGMISLEGLGKESSFTGGEKADPAPTPHTKKSQGKDFNPARSRGGDGQRGEVVVRGSVKGKRTWVAHRGRKAGNKARIGRKGGGRRRRREKAEKKTNCQDSRQGSGSRSLEKKGKAKLSREGGEKKPLCPKVLKMPLWGKKA